MAFQSVAANSSIIMFSMATFLIIHLQAPSYNPCAHSLKECLNSAQRVIKDRQDSLEDSQAFFATEIGGDRRRLGARDMNFGHLDTFERIPDI